MTRLLILAGLVAAALALRNRSPESALRIGAAVGVALAASALLGAAHRVAGLALAGLVVAAALAYSTRKDLHLSGGEHPGRPGGQRRGLRRRPAS